MQLARLPGGSVFESLSRLGFFNLLTCAARSTQSNTHIRFPGVKIPTDIELSIDLVTRVKVNGKITFSVWELFHGPVLSVYSHNGKSASGFCFF